MNPLHDFALVQDSVSRRSSSWDRTGGNTDSVPDVEPGQIVTLLDTQGPGKITHIWITCIEYNMSGHDTIMRDMVIRMYWDGSDVPSVEVPLGDFFGMGHGLSPETFYYPRKYMVNSIPVALGGNERAFNCYWPMPFHKSARIEIFNNGLRTARLLYYHVDYELAPQPVNAALFHAAFGQEHELVGQIQGLEEDYDNLSGKDNLVLLETEGKGHYAGCFFYVDCNGDSWWGEGDDMIYIDHDPMPTIIGTGSEDYFNNAWGYNHPFCHPYYGAPLVEKRPDGGSFMSLYRFHIPDPIRFQKHIKVSIEKWWSAKKTNALSYVVFWYQQDPIRSRKPLPRGETNHPRHRFKDPEWIMSGTDIEIPVPALEVPLREQGLEVHVTELIGRDGLHSKGGLLIHNQRKEIAIPLSVPQEGHYRVEIKPLYKKIEGTLELRIDGNAPVLVRKQTPYHEADGAFLNLGNISIPHGKLVLWAKAESMIPLHRIRLHKLHTPED